MISNIDFCPLSRFGKKTFSQKLPIYNHVFGNCWVDIFLSDCINSLISLNMYMQIVYTLKGDFRACISFNHFKSISNAFPAQIWREDTKLLQLWSINAIKVSVTLVIKIKV